MLYFTFCELSFFKYKIFCINALLVQLYLYFYFFISYIISLKCIVIICKKKRRIDIKKLYDINGLSIIT